MTIVKVRARSAMASLLFRNEFHPPESLATRFAERKVLSIWLLIAKFAFRPTSPIALTIALSESFDETTPTVRNVCLFFFVCHAGSVRGGTISILDWYAYRLGGL
jgi:hypothetical protein